MKKVICAAIAALIALSLVSCRAEHPNTVFSIADLVGKSVGVLEGTASESYLRGMTGSINIKLFSSANALAAELKNGGVDAALADEETAARLLHSSGLTSLDSPFVDTEYCIAVSEDNRELYDAVESAVVNLSRAGVLGKISEDWIAGKAEPYKDETSYRESLSIAVSDDFWPYSYRDESGELVGLEIDVARRICSELGVNAEFKVVKADMILYMAESGKVSFAIGRIPRGDASVLYTSGYISSKQEIIVRK
ncbi:MAG: transporter substrate-binding domain-containing protein [Oscillospiraceae bacterium]|nr:transporter substrate-binding domain-containing protein [Oscillospiraceae bacterium]